MKTIQKILLLTFCAFLPLLMAPTGGFPSRPSFQAVTVRSSDVTTKVTVNGGTSTSNQAIFFAKLGTSTGALCVSGTNGQCMSGDATGDMVLRAAGNRVLRLSVDDGATTEMTVTSTGISITDSLSVPSLTVAASPVLTLASGGNITVAPTIGGVAICTTSSCLAETTTTVSAIVVTGCTADPGVSATLVKHGNIVTMRWLIGGPGTCTSNATNFSIAGGLFPAGFQPIVVQDCPFIAQDNGVPIAAFLQVPTAGGSVNLRTAAASSIWTNAGTKGLSLGVAGTCSYVLN